MNVLKRLFGGTRKQGAAAEEADALVYYVRGHKCGAITRVRIDRRNDLSRDDDDSFFVRKVIVDSKCYGEVEIEMRFDPQYNETKREIKGGVFTTREEYDAQTTTDKQS